MTPLQLIKDYTQDCLQAPTHELSSVIAKYFSNDFSFNASHPINEINTIEEIKTAFWLPLKHAFKHLKRIDYIALDGQCPLTNTTWVACTGQYVGHFQNDLYTIPATDTSAHLRFGEFYAIEGGKITQVYVLFEYLRLMSYAGVYLLPKTLGSKEDIPAPQTGDGLQYGDNDPTLSEKNHALVVCMLAELLADRQKTSSKQKSYWAEDMAWYGPTGIGTFRGLEAFALYRNAFLNTFPDRDYGVHKGLIAKNSYVAISGWKSVQGTHKGSGWLGLAPTGKRVDMRVMDFWRVNNSLIEENWVLIDIPHIFLQLGIDLFANIGHLYQKVPFEIPSTVSNPVIDDPKKEMFKHYLLEFYQQYHTE